MTLHHSDFFTPTMAGIYASQGYLEEAVRIYAHILEKHPHREELKEALQAVKDRIENIQDESVNIAVTKSGEAKASPVFESWFRILLRYSHILKLRLIQKRIIEKRQGDKAKQGPEEK